MPNDENLADIQGAFARMQEINNKLNEPVYNTDEAALDEQRGLIDELINIDMGLGPFRRQMSQKAKDVEDAKDGKKSDETST